MRSVTSDTSNGNRPMNRAEVLQFYASGAESQRLQRGVAQLEAVRTKQLLVGALPAAPATILDVGGGTGAYAFWLAECGYTVHLVDPVPQLIAAARAVDEMSPRPLASIQVGDAVSLPFGDASTDALLLLGPLYHLTTEADRQLALLEARRVLRPGGMIFAAAITRWAGALYGLARDLYKQEGFTEQVAATLESGQNRNPTGLSGGFMTAYYHRPEELAHELATAGFADVSIHGVEGPACLLADFEARWANPEQRRVLEWAAQTLGDEPSLLGASAHLLAIARAPDSEHAV